jgi:pyruvate carboxylase subunit B
MPGLVVRVEVEPGQAVVAGQGIVVLEAMKMENELRASAAATVAAVRVAPGATVEKGEVLVEYLLGPGA